MQLDYLVLAAHPDDAELFCGGTIIRMRQAGYRVGVLDLTRGEAASQGSVAQRQQETAQANQILQLHWRHNLGLPDSGLSDCPEMRRALVEQLRVVRPGVVIAPWTPCRHPDHQALHQLARSVCFFAGAGGYDTGQPPWRPQRLIHHLEYEDVKPSFVIDISDQFADRERAIDCYSTQFFTGTAAGTTVVGSRLFRHRMVSRCAYYGALIGCEYGEPYITTETLRIDDPLAGLQVN